MKGMIFMKKHHKILLLSAAVLASAQPLMTPAQASASSEKAASSAINSRKELPRVPVSLGSLPIKHHGQPFKDISHSIFKDYINEIYRLGITTGYTPSTYNPNGNVTRGEMAVFLYRLAGSPNYKAPFNVFKDVTQYKNQILWLSAANITQGTGSKYNPNGNVTRGQMAAFLHRMAVASGKASPSKKYDAHFIDAKKHMFSNDIGWLRTQGITTGYTPTSFKPDASISRGEMAAFLQRFYMKINNQNQAVNQISLKVKNITLYKGDSWNAKDNFISATDKNGKSVPFSQVKVTSTVNTNNEGTYKVTYSYGGKTVQAQIIVKNRMSLAKSNLIAYSEDKNIEIMLRDNLNTLINKDGKDVLATDKNKVKITAKNDQNQVIELANLTNTAGTYTITYTYDNKSLTAMLTVSAANLPKLSEDGKTVQFMNQTWSVIRKLPNNNYLIGGQQKLSNSKFTDGDNFFNTNDSHLDGYTNSLVKTKIDEWYNKNIKGTMYEYAVQPVVLSNPTLGNLIELNILKTNTTDNLNTNWWKTGEEKYRTTVNSSGSKQAFALSSADVSTGTQQENNWWPVLSEDGIAYRNALKSAGIDYTWLRSPGVSHNLAADLYSSFGNVVSNYVTNPSGAVVPSLAVRIDNEHVK